MRLTAETDRDAVSAHVTGRSERVALRTSQARADRLQRNARIRTGWWDLQVRIEADQRQPARIVEDAEGPAIVLSGHEVPQPVTEFPPREWDLLVQTVLVMHEVAHLDHSDLTDLGDRLEAVPPGWQAVAGQLWNAFEDGMVEAAIRDRWPNYGRWFDIVRANLVAGTGPGIVDPAGGRVYPIIHSTVLGIIDSIGPSTGTYDRLLDPEDDGHHFARRADRELFEGEVAPLLSTAIEDIARMAEPVERNSRVLAFFESVRPIIETARADGRAQVAALESGAWGMPDDASRSASMGDATPLDSFPSIEEGGSSQEATAQDGKPIHRATESIDPDEGTEPATEDEPDDELLQTLSESIADQQRQDSTQRDSRVESLERMQAAVEAAETELESDGVVLPTEERVADEATVAAAREDGARLARVLRNRFQKRHKRSIERQTRRGRLDPSALHRHATGEKRLKHRHERPDQLDHHCLFVLDRSGSMRNHIRVAERAMGMLVYALESVDVDVEVLELLDKEVRLAKPPDQEADRATERLFHGDATGGTPLTDTLHIARERLKQERGKRFLFVITDGRPADPDRYREALNRFSVPVVGVNLTTDEATGASEFHRQVTVAPAVQDLRGALRQLVQEVLFD